MKRTIIVVGISNKHIYIMQLMKCIAYLSKDVLYERETLVKKSGELYDVNLVI